MEERDQLIAELEKVAVGSGAIKYVQILRRRQERDGVKLGLLKDLLRHARNETHEGKLELDAVASGFFAFSSGIWLGDSTPSLPDLLGPSVIVVVFLPTDASSRTCAAGDFMVSAAGSASNGSVTGCKTTSKSGTNVCASGVKHVTVAVAVPSLIIALKQYLFVNVMTLLLTCLECPLLLECWDLGKSKVDLLQVLDVNYTTYAPGSGCIAAPKGIAYAIDTSDCSGKLALEIGTMLVYILKVRVMSFGSVRSHAFVVVHRKREIISSLCGGKPAKFSEFRYSAGYSSSVSPSSFPCGTASSKLRSASAVSESGMHNSGDSSSKFSGIWKYECAVLPDGNNNAAIPEAVTVRTIFSSERKTFESLRAISSDRFFHMLFHSCTGSETLQKIRI
uniref:Uncharacterized protein n=1 Tax=Tanacetum cinerariifolium TaxID=118510 RepID=A0A6L2MDC2_TANCI|nr:hypothetical protein [Tanacetum cinerariifolium]